MVQIVVVVREPDRLKPDYSAGMLHEVILECDPALSPYSSDTWRRGLGNGKNPRYRSVGSRAPREADLKLRTLA